MEMMEIWPWFLGENAVFAYRGHKRQKYTATRRQDIKIQIITSGSPSEALRI